MKNLKMIMTAVGVFAIVGTSLALNAKRFGVQYCVSQSGPSLTCEAAPLSRKVVTSGGIQTWAVQKNPSFPCTNNTIHKCNVQQLQLANE